MSSSAPSNDRHTDVAADIRADEPFGTVEGGVPLPESMKDMPLIDARDVSAAYPYSKRRS